jgi:vitamin B12 transporter
VNESRFVLDSHWVARRNSAPGKATKRTRQPGYRPTKVVRRPWRRALSSHIAGGEAGAGCYFESFMVHKHFLRRAGVPLALTTLCVSSFAQSTLAPVVVTASRTEQRVQDALPSTTVLTRADIDAAQTPDMPTLLQRVAGLQITQTGGPGTQSGVSLRGGETRHTLVLVDGVAINDLNFGLASIENLSLADVDRIEIVRGNVSSLYGSAALGGVIQIFTRTAGNKPSASVTVQGGSRGLVQSNASGSVKLASGTGLRADVETLRDRGFDATNHDELPATNPDRDGYRRTAAGFAITQDIAGGHTVGLRAREEHGRTEYDSQFGPATQADVSKSVERSAVLDGHFKLGGKVVLAAALTDAADEIDASETAYPYFVHSRSNGGQVGIEWQVATGQRITAGVEHTRQRITSDTVYNQSSRTQDSARLGYTLASGPHDLQLNIRKDRYTTFGSANTWLAAYGYRITDAWRISASASTGFNAPTFNDLYYPFGANPDLRPERLRAHEVALQYAAAGQVVRATLFDNRYRDLFGFDPFFTRINIGHARNRGLELTWTGRVGDTSVNAGLTSQDPRDEDTGERLQRRAATLGKFGVSRETGPWQYGADLRYTGSSPDAGHTLGSYAVLDLTASCRVSAQVRVFGRVENAGDRRYESVYGYRQAGRGIFVGVNWKPSI